MERIQYITGLREYEGLPLRAISERAGHHFDTIKKYVEREDWNEEIKPRKQRESKLDPLKPIIDTWLEDNLKMPRKQRHTGMRVYDRLSKEPEYAGQPQVGRQSISGLFKQDLEAMLPLPKQRFKVTRLEKAKTDKCGCSTFRTCGQ